MRPRSVDRNLLHRLVRQILLEEWDPIGVHDEPKAQDEYDEYVPRVTRMLGEGTSTLQVADYLVSVETEMMGLRADEARARRVAERLVARRDAT